MKANETFSVKWEKCNLGSLENVPTSYIFTKLQKHTYTYN